MQSDSSAVCVQQVSQAQNQAPRYESIKAFKVNKISIWILLANQHTYHEQWELFEGLAAISLTCCQVFAHQPTIFFIYNIASTSGSCKNTVPVPLRHHFPSQTLLRLKTNQIKRSERQAVRGETKLLVSMLLWL